MTLAIVVPCYQEADRLDPVAFQKLADAIDQLVFVDDGSRDATPDLLRQIASSAPGRIRVIESTANRGKAEAVRLGMQAALDAGATSVGYYDADLATPPSELLRLVERLDRDPALQAVLGSRVALLGHTIERRATRHYLGRIYATAASLVLGIGVYDTQCGAKLFRRSPALEAALTDPFPERWSFDVELLARLLSPPMGVPAVTPEEIVEVPLGEWRDVSGSKLGLGGSVRSALALLGVRRRMRRRQTGR